MTADSMEFYNVDEEPIEKSPTHIDWDVDAAEKGGYEHFMLKEMYEQPKAIADTFSPRIRWSGDRDRGIRYVGGGNPGGEENRSRWAAARLSRGVQIRDRGNGKDPGRGGSCVGIPLPGSTDRPGHASDRDQSVRETVIRRFAKRREAKRKSAWYREWVRFDRPVGR